MSYEGVELLLCKNGHKWKVDHRTYMDSPDGLSGNRTVCKCNFCNSPAAYICSVDYTNGYDPDDPTTYPGLLVENGWEDLWQKDHYGNKYATKIMKYLVPENSTRWLPLRI